jgi:hypothetical protein
MNFYQRKILSIWKQHSSFWKHQRGFKALTLQKKLKALQRWENGQKMIYRISLEELH